MADTALLFYGWLFGQPLPIYGAFAGVGIYGEVTDLKGSEILEEMAALRWGDAKIAESGLNNRPRAGDFIPFYGDAEPGFGRSPAAYADQEIGAVLLVETAIELSYGGGYFLAAAALEALRIDYYYIVQIVYCLLYTSPSPRDTR